MLQIVRQRRPSVLQKHLFVAFIPCSRCSGWTWKCSPISLFSRIVKSTTTLLLFLTLTFKSFMDSILYDSSFMSLPPLLPVCRLHTSPSQRNTWVCVIFVMVASDFIQIILLDFFTNVYFFVLTLLAHAQFRLTIFVNYGATDIPSLTPFQVFVYCSISNSIFSPRSLYKRGRAEIFFYTMGIFWSIPKLKWLQLDCIQV